MLVVHQDNLGKTPRRTQTATPQVFQMLNASPRFGDQNKCTTKGSYPCVCVCTRTSMQAMPYAHPCSYPGQPGTLMRELSRASNGPNLHVCLLVLLGQVRGTQSPAAPAPQWPTAPTVTLEARRAPGPKIRRPGPKKALGFKKARPGPKKRTWTKEGTHLGQHVKCTLWLGKVDTWNSAQLGRDHVLPE